MVRVSVGRGERAKPQPRRVKVEKSGWERGVA